MVVVVVVVVVVVKTLGSGDDLELHRDGAGHGADGDAGARGFHLAEVLGIHLHEPGASRGRQADRQADMSVS